MFRAPNIISNIPDIKQIYKINENQISSIVSDIDAMDMNVFLDTMSESHAERWEKILAIVPDDDATIDERRFAIKTKIFGKKVNTLKSLIKALEELCGERVNVDRTGSMLTVYLPLSNIKNKEKINEMIDDVLPLDMIYGIIVMYNLWQDVATITWGEAHAYTWDQIRSDLSLRG